MSAFLKSTFITNRDATPKVLSDSFLVGGQYEEVIGSVLVGAADTAKSFYRLVTVPSNARVSEIWWQADAIGSSGSTSLDVGVFYPTTIPQGGANFLANTLAGTLISSSIFATALTAAAPVALTQITNQSLNYLIPNQELPLWQVLGLTADPEIDFDLGFSVRVATLAAGYVGLKCKYQY